MAAAKRKNQTNKHRKGKRAWLYPWLKRFGFTVLFIGILTGIAAWIYTSGTIDKSLNWADAKNNEMMADAGFKVEEILLEGRHHADPQIIMALINMQKGDPLFAFDPKAAKDQISKMAWVKEVQVERRLPGTIYIKLTEYMPVALLQKDETLHLLNEEGGTISTDNLTRFKDLILITGSNAQEKSVDLLNLLNQKPEFKNRIETAQRISDRRWDLTLKNGLEIKLPETDPGQAIEKLMTAQNDDQILDKDIKHIDLRGADRMIIRTKPGMVQDYKAGLHNASGEKSDI